MKITKIIPCILILSVCISAWVLFRQFSRSEEAMINSYYEQRSGKGEPIEAYANMAAALTICGNVEIKEVKNDSLLKSPTRIIWEMGEKPKINGKCVDVYLLPSKGTSTPVIFGTWMESVR